MRRSSIAAMMLIVFANSMIGCGNHEQEKKIADLEKALADVEAKQNAPWEPDPAWSYVWFDLGQDFRQTVNQFFYVAKISTTYKQNGFQVNGLIGNLTSMPMTVVRVKGAIKKTGTKELTIGTTDIPVLLAGQKSYFSLFIPTDETKISSVGITVEDYRQ